MSVPGFCHTVVRGDQTFNALTGPNVQCRFLGVDTLWALCMGFNVYLALFRGWSSERMRRQEWKYFLGCYGCSFIPALVYLFVNTKRRGKIYGPALVSTRHISEKQLLTLN